MNDPTNFDVDPSIKSIEVADPAMAKEMSKRWNAYPGLVAFVKKACDTRVTRPEALAILRALGEESVE